MRGEDRTHGHHIGQRGDPRGLDSRLPHGRDHAGQGPAVLAPGGGCIVGALDLLGHIGQVEIDRERPGQAGGHDQVGGGQQLRRGLRIRPDEGAHLLHEVEEVLALLADEGVTEEVPEGADMAPQPGVGGHGAIVPIGVSGRFRGRRTVPGEIRVSS